MSQSSSWKEKYIEIIRSGIWANEQIFFYPKLKRFYKEISISSNPVIFDVGANKGQTLDFFLKIFPYAKIFAFEPNKKIYEKLVQNYTRNNIELQNVAVSSQSGFATFYESIVDETSSLEKADPTSKYMKFKSQVLLSNPEEMFKTSYPVKTITLDDFVEMNGITKIDILKIDVEGHELSVLEGYKKTLQTSLTKYIQLEEHLNDQYVNRSKFCKQLLEENNYKEVYRIRHGFGNFFEIIYEKS